jgi:hypothetical protein
MPRIVISLSLLLSVAAGAQAPQLTSLSTFGCESCSGPALFGGIRAISVAADGHIVVADKSAPIIRIFDSSGRSIASFGRDGNGPGELRNPIAIVVRSDRGVDVVDLGRRALVRLDPSGRDRGLVPIDGFPTAASVSPANGMALIGITGPRSPSMRILRVNGDATLSDLLRADAQEFPSRRMQNVSTLSIAMAPDGSFAVGDGEGEYLVRRYAPNGAFLSEIRRTVQKVKRTPAEIEELARRQADELARMQALLGRSPSSTAPSTATIPQERNYFDPDALGFDEKGRLWVRVERGTQSETVFDVFDASGRYAGEVKLDLRIAGFALGAGMLATVAANRNGVEQVVLWRVE